MPTTDPRVDAYSQKAAPFARPILTRIRAVVHTACPDVEETMTWNATFGFWKGPLLAGRPRNWKYMT